MVIMVVAIFILSISGVLIGMVLKLDRLPQHTENRKLAEIPSLKFDIEILRKYPINLKNYFNDHFCFRNTFVKMNFLIRHNIFHESPSRLVLLGKNGWYFLTDDRAIEDYRGITHFEEETLQGLAKSYENKREYLLKKGIRYILVLAPNKETIYGEWMPDYLFKIRNRSGLDEVTEYIKKNTSVDIIDLRITLFENKMREQLYLKTSSHWNEYAAFLAYREIMKPVSQWFPEAKADSLEEFTIKREEIRGSELTEMMGGADFFREQNVLLVPKKPRKARKVDFHPSGTYKDPFAMELESTYLPRVVVFRDCFFDNVIPYISEHTQYTKYYWQSWNPDTPIEDIINTVRPDIVIEEKIERFLKYPKSPT